MKQCIRIDQIKWHPFLWSRKWILCLMKSHPISMQSVRSMLRWQFCPPCILQALTAVAVLTLRSPVNASEAVKSGVVDVTGEMMERHTGSPGLQRQACQLIRNLAVRNLENRYGDIVLHTRLVVCSHFLHGHAVERRIWWSSLLSF